MPEPEGSSPDPVIVVVGPTASGKSSLAEHLALALDGEIVSADALQVYQGLDIGTAKPSAEIRSRIRHHCVDILPPDGRCTAGEYGRRARSALEAIADRGRPAVLVGGSGFYIRAALRGLDRLPPTSPAWREALTGLAESGGEEHLHRWLARLDPSRAAEIDAGDRHRLVRALEIVLRTGRPLEEQPGPEHPPVRPVLVAGLRWSRPQLYGRIDERVDRMLDAGWLAEVEELLEGGLSPGSHALQAIGYRELVAVVRGEMELERAREAIERATRRYAKRQLAWFRNQMSVDWYRVDGQEPGVRPGEVRERVLSVARERLGAI